MHEEKEKIDKLYESLKFQLGRRILSLRVENVWPQLQLAEQAGLYRPKIINIEKGKDNLEFPTIVKVASGLQLEMVNLFDFINAFPLQKNKNTNFEDRLAWEKKQFADRLFEILNDRKKSQIRLSIDSGISEADISLIKKGDKNFKLYQLARLEFVLEADAADFFAYGEPLPGIRPGKA